MAEADARRRIVASARDCLGVRFVPQGRDPKTGLDCVGLAAHAFGSAGLSARAPQYYRLRGGSAAGWRAQISRPGIEPVAPREASAGDLLLLEAGSRQFHLAIHSGAGFIHADARLRRVVETPGEPAWPVRAAWRIIEGEG